MDEWRVDTVALLATRRGEGEDGWIFMLLDRGIEWPTS
jgi:hypothetical protein